MAGALTHSPADVIRYLLIDEGLGTLPSVSGSWPVYAANEPDTPDNCITVYHTSNTIHGREMTAGETQEHEGVQIRIRSAGHNTGYVKADTIKRALDTSVSWNTVTISGTDYLVHAVHRTTGVLSLGKDLTNSRRDLFTINAVASLRQST